MKSDADVAALGDAPAEVDATGGLDVDGSGEPAVPCETLADCPAPAPCRGAGVCDSGSHTCVYAPLDGPACDDGDACTVAGVCVNGACISAPKDCDDAIACTTDSCAPGGQCVHGVAGCDCKKDADCEDEDPCTLPAACENLTCFGREPVDCSAFDSPCHAGRCEAATGSCVAEPKADESPCDDGDPCTVGDSCQGLACSGGPKSCDDGEQCTSDSCDATSGKCVHAPLPNGSACDDGDLCTIADSCNAGACAGVLESTLSVAWEVQFEGLAPGAALLRGGTADGGAVLVVEVESPFFFGFSEGQWIAAAPQTKRGGGAFVGGLWIGMLDGTGALVWQRTLGGSEKLSLNDATFSPTGDAFLLVEYSGTLEGAFPAISELFAARTKPGQALVAISSTGELMWALPIPTELDAAALFYSGGQDPRVGAVVRHTAQYAAATQPAGVQLVLPAATVGTSLGALSWSAISGQLKAMKSIGGLSDAAVESVVRVRGADGGGFAVALDAYDTSWLGGPLAVPATPKSTDGVLVGVFTADGMAVYVASIDGPIGARVGGVAFRAESGLLVLAATLHGIAVTDGTGATAGASANSWSPLLPPYCAVRLNPAGQRIWPIHCDEFAGFTEGVLEADGTALALGLGHAVQAPTGAIYSLTTTPQEIMRFLGQLTSDGDILSLATWDLAGACINPRLDPSRAVFCDEVQPGEGLIRLMKRTEFAPLPNCLL